ARGRAGAARLRLSAVVGRLPAVNFLASATGFISGPLLARALGAHGRGDLAAVLVPLSLAPTILSLGVPGYAAREAARGRAPREVIGSVGLPLLLGGACVAAIGAFPAAAVLADGRETVRVLLVIGFALLPISLLS